MLLIIFEIVVQQECCVSSHDGNGTADSLCRVKVKRRLRFHLGGAAYQNIL